MSPSHVPTFFLSPPPARRDLHSFPTRRSSDLPDLNAKRSGAGGDETGDGAVPQQSEQDRKSTRLNSSHLGISYAVFCLKKKTKEEHHRSGADRQADDARQRVRQAVRQ